jgi:hypothetical protein
MNRIRRSRIALVPLGLVFLLTLAACAGPITVTPVPADNYNYADGGH